jgi:hypothetical protein
MSIRRTTLAAEADDLALLEREARRRGVSLAQVLRELVAHEADTLRARHRPRFGLGRSGSGAAAAAAADEHAPVRERDVRA